MGKEAHDRGSAFVATTGDNFYTFGVTSRFDPQWQSSFENIYTSPSLQAPWFACLGNHDYYGDPDAQIAYSEHSARWHMPGRWYVVEGRSIGHPEVDLFFLDTLPLYHVSKPRCDSWLTNKIDCRSAHHQLLWLEDALRRSRARWKLVFGHHPIVSAGPHGATAGLRELLLPRFHGGGVKAYIHGHDHSLQHIIEGDVHHICSGAGSQVTPVRDYPGIKFAISKSGFASISIARETAELRFLDYKGESVYRTIFKT